MTTKDTTIQIRVTKAEKKLIAAAAKREGVSVSNWLRILALRHKEPAR